MTKPDILQLSAYPAWDQEPLDAAFTMHKLFEAKDQAAFLAEIGPRIRAIATTGARGADAALIAACPNLELIAAYGVGYDAVDLAACKARGIALTNTPDVLTGDCADLAVGMMLALLRGIVPGDAWARSGDWAAKGSFPLRRRAFGRRAGILGLGRIGRAIADRLTGFDMEIAYATRTPRRDAPAAWRYIPDPVALADWSDILFVALPGSAATRHVVDAKVLSALGPEGWLINISRASNIDEQALLTALESGTLAGAALDVFDNEPALNPRFTKLSNILLQPHQASGTVETRKAMGQLMRDNLTAHFAGKPLPTPVTL